MIVNVGKTKVMVVEKKKIVTDVNGEDPEQVEEFRYHGSHDQQKADFLVRWDVR